jgi:hypothetical protein
MKTLHRFHRFLHCLTHLHKPLNQWEEAKFKRPNRFGLRSAWLHVEMSCECGKVFWQAGERGGPHD